MSSDEEDMLLASSFASMFPTVIHDSDEDVEFDFVPSLNPRLIRNPEQLWSGTCKGEDEKLEEYDSFSNQCMIFHVELATDEVPHVFFF